ncbi:MAG: SWIM zinc finger family protein [Anaerolineae bacterium]|nr:SWIM zinc finger family protein [Anaerolineae bacterium]
MNWWDDEPEFDEYTLNDYETPPEAIVLDGPVRAVSKRGPIGTEWWGRQWVAAMERLGVTGRLERGKRYARNGAVLSLEIGHGLSFARVQGSYGYAYRTAVELKTFSDQEWTRALAALSEQAIYAARLLAGEMPADIEAVFQSVGLSLFPRSLKDILFECSCPDWGDPCKHAAAVYYLLAEQMDADPFILFHLRGRTREQVLAALRSHRSSAANGEVLPETAEAPSLDADLAAFWSGPTHHLIRAVPLIPDAFPLLRQLGQPPGNAASALQELYNEMSVEAFRWLGLDDNGE